MDSYTDFIASKTTTAQATGLATVPELNAALFPYQADIVGWALRRGRAAIFADCGMGKTLMQLEWARAVVEATGGNVLILTPLAVGQQTAREAERFGIVARVSRDGTVHAGITIANYQSLHKFKASDFAGVVLDESSILKAFSGKTKRMLVETFAQTPFRLACTATPAPNDHTELGNHAEFLGVLDGSQMLARFFINDTSNSGNYRLKGHAERDFWEWVASWAVCIAKPSDLLPRNGIPHDDTGFAIPELIVKQETVEIDLARVQSQKGTLFAMGTLNATDLHSEMRQTADARAQRVADIIAREPGESWTVWCNTNYEADALMARIAGAVEVRGADTDESKEAKMSGFESGLHRVLVTKPMIAGFGMNWQHCARVAFVGLSYSYEQLYQSLRRSWRFGQPRAVHAYIVTAETELGVLETVLTKQAEHAKMQAAMVAAMRVVQGGADVTAQVEVGNMEVASSEKWTAINGDCVVGVTGLAENSVDFAIFSPPFANLYVYTDTPADMGNCDGDAQFFEHFRHLITPMHRAMRPGRIVAIHCKNLVNYAGSSADGMAGIRDFRGDIIRAMTDCGFAFHSEVCIWKCPVTEMQRTKANGLLHKTIKRDSTFSRQGMPDYLLMFRKWPANDAEVEMIAPVTHTPADFPVELWQQYASPVWFDIDQTDVLNVRIAREDKDEKHLCPLQLGVIRRALKLWSNPGDLVLSPFMGIGSEGFVSLQEGRRFVGTELKPSYWKQACANLALAEKGDGQIPLFGDD